MPSSPSSPASASPARTSPPWSSTTRSSSAPGWTRRWPPASPSSPTSACPAPRSRASSRWCLEVIKTNYGVLSSNVEAVIKPNLAVLKECGISIADRPSYAFASRVISRPTKHLEEAVVLANEFGAKQGTRVFTNAVMIFGILGQEKLAKKLEFFKKLGWSQDDLSLAVRSMPHILAMKEERMRRGMKFLTEDVGLEIPYIARRPALTMYSIERRLLPRHCLINVLKGNGLLKANYDFYNISVISNDDFMEKFVQPYVESVPGLGDAYASSCTGCGVHQLKLLSKRKTKC
ncbi:hypothetical protein DAI22_06g085700 [Oryza sativa Japonica Group]|nr:hypothetical protein DAI22_06g085700 [Oryza sativa Japonica Group]